MKNIEHTGRVVQIEKDKVQVSIITESACASCHARKMCMGDEKEKLVTAMNPQGDNFMPGEQVKVTLSQSTGMTVIFLAYILPIILIVATLLILKGMDYDEGITGLATLGVVAVYYFFLFILRGRIDKKIEIFIEKLQ